jgi:hypothetical protein
MHGQKKRRKRTIEGTMKVDGLSVDWELLSEPQYSNSGDGRIGLRIRVCVADSAQRELIIEYPYPTNGRGLPKPVPQRPQVSQPMVEKSVHQALEAGWDPHSRGKAFIFHPERVE